VEHFEVTFHQLKTHKTNVLYKLLKVFHNTHIKEYSQK